MQKNPNSQRWLPIPHTLRKKIVWTCSRGRKGVIQTQRSAPRGRGRKGLPPNDSFGSCFRYELVSRSFPVSDLVTTDRGSQEPRTARVTFEITIVTHPTSVSTTLSQFNTESFNRLLLLDAGNGRRSKVRGACAQHGSRRRIQSFHTRLRRTDCGSLPTCTSFCERRTETRAKW